MISSKRKFKIFLGIEIAAVLLTLGVSLFFVMGKIKANRQSLDFQRKILTILDLREREFQIFQRKKSAFREEIECLQKAFVRRDAPVDFIEFLEALGEKFSLPLKINPFFIEKQPFDLWRPLAFEITTAGSFEDCFRFIKALENGPYIAEIYFANEKVLKEEDIQSWRFKDFKPGQTGLFLKVKVFSGDN